MDEFMVYLITEGTYGLGVMTNDTWSVEFFIEGIRHLNNFDEDELEVVRLLEEL